ncbi:MAG: hypothetical protein LBC68_13500, partial [Prevotellaceae bacterium]|nr:hypothetical protein [Prevotellaceae bacterium]
MEKQKIVVNYKNSGVETLNGFGTFFFVLGCISALVCIVGIVIYADDSNYEKTAYAGLSLASAFLPIAIGSLAFGAICKGLATMAKTSLYKRTLLEQQYEFEGKNEKWWEGKNYDGSEMQNENKD